jgi:capping protein beta
MSEVTAALNVMRRLPPSRIELNLHGLLNLVPGASDELLQRVDQPLQVRDDTVSGKKYLLCDYNRDGDSYRLVGEGAEDGGRWWVPTPRCDHVLTALRPLGPTRSPWSNKYFPAIDDGFVPSDRLRKLEVQANEVFDEYRDL